MKRCPSFARFHLNLASCTGTGSRHGRVASLWVKAKCYLVRLLQSLTCAVTRVWRAHPRSLEAHVTCMTLHSKTHRWNFLKTVGTFNSFLLQEFSYQKS